MTTGFYLLTAASFVVALCIPIALRPALRRAGVIDFPNHRSSHDVPVLRGAGLGQAITVALAFAFVLIFLHVDKVPIATLLVATCGMATLGWIEDFCGVPIAMRAGAQFVIGALVVGAAAYGLDAPLLWALLGGVAFTGFVNVVNFMDGINGISVLHAIVAGVTFAIIGELNDLQWMVIAGALLAAIFGAFLPWNFRGQMFLGDVGSYLLGGLIAGVVVLGWMQGAPLVALVAPMSIYLLDVAVTLIERIATGQKWYEAHRDHIYQRLVRAGASHISVATGTAFASTTIAILGLLISESHGPAQLAYIAGITAVTLVYMLSLTILRTSTTSSLDTDNG